MVAYAGAFTA